MKRYLKIFIAFLLLFNSTGALYGGINLLLYPDGSGLGMPVSLLQYTLFKNYLLPGLILFLVNGLFGLFVLITLLKDSTLACNLIIIQGLLFNRLDCSAGIIAPVNFCFSSGNVRNRTMFNNIRNTAKTTCWRKLKFLMRILGKNKARPKIDLALL